MPNGMRRRRRRRGRPIFKHKKWFISHNHSGRLASPVRSRTANLFIRFEPHSWSGLASPVRGRTANLFIQASKPSKPSKPSKQASMQVSQASQASKQASKQASQATKQASKQPKQSRGIVSLSALTIVPWGKEPHMSSNPYGTNLLPMKNEDGEGGIVKNEITSVIINVNCVCYQNHEMIPRSVRSFWSGGASI